MKIKYLSFLFLLLQACNSGSTEGNIETTAEQSQEISDKNPCEILTEDMVRKALDLDSNLELSKDDTYSVCSYNWTVESEAASESDQITAILNAAKTGNTSATLDIASKGQYSVSFNFSTLQPKDASEAARGFEMVVQRLQGGVSVSKEKVKEEMAKKGMDPSAVDEYVGEDGFSFSSGEIENVAEVGDKAVWSDKNGQMTVLCGTHVFFVNAKTGGDKVAAKNTATIIAQAVCQKL